MPSVQRTLNRTARRIETFGWTRGQMGNHQVGYCLVGAIKAETRGRYRLRSKVYRELRQRLKLPDPTTADAAGNALGFADLLLMSWNDSWATEEHDVLKLLRGEEPDTYGDALTAIDMREIDKFLASTDEEPIVG